MTPRQRLAADRAAKVRYRPSNAATFWPDYKARTDMLAKLGDPRAPIREQVWREFGSGRWPVR